MIFDLLRKQMADSDELTSFYRSRTLDSAACDIDLEYNLSCDATGGVASYDANGMLSE